MKKSIILQDCEEVFKRDINWDLLKNKSILITGAGGMLASYVVFMLLYLNKYHNFNTHIIALVRSEEKFRSKFKEYDISSISVISNSLDSPIVIGHSVDFIIHAASLASPQYYDVCPVDVLSPNVIGTYYLLKLAIEKNIKGFLLFSTGDIYGKTDGKEYISEKDMGLLNPLDIHSCYSESKRMAETMCYSFMHQYNVPIRIVRIWHTYAPTMDINNDPRVFSSFVKNIIQGQDIEIKSDGTGKRAFCYIADALAGFFTVLTRGTDGEAYNVCNTNQYVSIRELALTLASLRNDCNINVTWKKRSEDEHYTENTAIGVGIPDNTKLKGLGWDTHYSIEDGFSRVVDYQLDKYKK